MFLPAILMCLMCIHSMYATIVKQMEQQFEIAPNISTTNSEFKFASYFSDHMVLQAAPYNATIWGYAPKESKGASVSVVLNDVVTYNTTVNADLTWTVSVGPIKVGGPYTVAAQFENSTIQITDVLFGDVWLCSGQSNMQFELDKVFNASLELKDALNYPDVRVFSVMDKTSDKPLSDLPSDGIEIPWMKPTAGKTKFDQFSAVCWLYGKYLYEVLHKPIGLVETSWGGTPIEAWSSPTALSKCGLANKNLTLLPERSKCKLVWAPLPGIPKEMRWPVKMIELPILYCYCDNVCSEKKNFTRLEGPNDNSVLWNAMVHPLLKMTIYGAIWYQGEANTKKNRNLYSCTFPAMIDDWRKQFHENTGSNKLLPFGFVQLSGYRPAYNVDTGFPDIRWHQTADYGYVPNHRQRNVFMAVAMDLPDFLSPYTPIHPRDKQDVAARLARGGLAIAYGYNISYQGPYPVDIKVHQNDPTSIPLLTVEYTMNLTQKWLDGFEVCCSFTPDKVCKYGKSWWLPTATEVYRFQANMTVSYVMQCKLENIIGIRYAWRDSPCPFKTCAIYGAENKLPLPPFEYHTDTFKRNFTETNSFVVKV